MPRRFGGQCQCCGVARAKLSISCEGCEAPQAQFEVIGPALYGEPIAVVIQALVHVVRDEVEIGKQLIVKWRTGGEEALDESDFAGIAQITGMQLVPAAVLLSANKVAAAWLFEGSNEHVPATFAILYERYFIETVFDDPEGLSYLGLLESVGLTGHNRELTQRPSESFSCRHLQFAERNLVILARLEERQEGSAIPTEEQVSVGVLRWLLENEVKGAPFEHHSYALDQMDGFHQMVQMYMTDLTPVRTLQDGWNYIQRLREFPARFDLICNELKLQKELNIFPPRFVVEKVHKQITKMHEEIVEKPEENCMYTSLVERLTSEDGGAGLKEVPSEMKDAARTALANEVVAAFGSVLKPLQALLDIVSADGYKDHAGVQALPQGPEYYAWRLAKETSTNMSPEQVHQLGNEQVKGIMDEMEQVIARLALSDPTLDPVVSVSKNIEKLRNDPRWTYPDSEEGKEMCLTEFRSLVEAITKLTDHLFDLQPKQPIKIQPVPKHMEDGSPGAFYMPPSLDGTRDGVFYANLGDMKTQYKFGMRTLTAHEAIPGHHYQISLQYEMKGLPHFRKTADGFNAFIEGWALYTEKVARELGFYATEADNSEGYDLLGHFGDELMRAARLVVDTGLHFYGWSRQQAIDYMENHTILAPSDVITEVERYCVLPGQACSYKIGQLEILMHRKELKDKLGDAFDPRAFHRCLLSAGAIPVAMLPQVTASMLATKA